MQNYFFRALCLLTVHLIQAQAQGKSIKDITEEEQSQIIAVLFHKPDDNTRYMPLKQENLDNGVEAYLVESSIGIHPQPDVAENDHSEGSENDAENAALIDQIPPSRYKRLVRKGDRVPPSRYPYGLADNQSRKPLLLKQVQKSASTEERTPPSRYRMVKSTPKLTYKATSDRREVANEAGYEVSGANARKTMANNKRDTPPSRYQGVQSHVQDQEKIQRLLDEAIRRAMMSFSARVPSKNNRQKELINKGSNEEAGVQVGGIQRKMSQGLFIKHDKDGTRSLKRPRYAKMIAREARENLYPLSAEKRIPMSRYGAMSNKRLMQTDGITTDQIKELDRSEKKTPPSRYPKLLTPYGKSVELRWMSGDMYAIPVNRVVTAAKRNIPI